MAHLLDEAGLRLDKIFGDFDGSVFTEKSPRLVLIGARI
jgi:hypothetical protein